MSKTISQHRLQRIFEAKSIAVLGASTRPNSFGEQLVNAVAGMNYLGNIYWVNPKYTEIAGHPCFPSLDALQEADIIPDLVILGVAGERVLSLLTQCVEMNIGGAVLFDKCYINESTVKNPEILQQLNGQTLVSKLTEIANAANFPIIGGNCMGFMNIHGQQLGTYYPASHLKAGGISLIAQSGSVFSVLAFSDDRYRFDILVSTGQEISTKLEEIVDYVIDRNTTKVIALFLETSRTPELFKEVLLKAKKHFKPVVICKVGRTDSSKQAAFSHTGAIAGNYQAYLAIMRQCGAIVVDNVDQLMNVAMLCSYGRIPPTGKLGLVSDSGGLREVTIDRADDLTALLAAVEGDLEQRLTEVIEPHMSATNPVDCGGDIVTGFEIPYRNSLKVFAEHHSVSMIGYESDLTDDYIYHPPLFDVALELPSYTEKPVFAYSSFAQVNNKRIASQLADANVPMINGLDEMLIATNLYQKWAETKDLSVDNNDNIQANIVRKWEQYFSNSNSQQVSEQQSLEFFNDCDLPTVCTIYADSETSLKQAYQQMLSQVGPVPVVLKTAAGIAHKTEVNGVFLNLTDWKAVVKAYQTLQATCGDQVILQQMITASQGSTIELALGFKRDDHFGPLMMISAGGKYIELFNDQQFAIAPISPDYADHLIQQMSIAKLFQGYRGSDAIDLQQLTQVIARFSVLCNTFASQIAEIDINPICISNTSITIVDGLISLNCG